MTDTIPHTAPNSFPRAGFKRRFGSWIYDLLIVIKYNITPVIKKKGSAIFLHLSGKNYKPTKGCVAISKNSFLKILPFISKKTKILID